MHKQAQDFDNFANQIVQFDTEYIANMCKATKLQREYEQLQERQQRMDLSIEQIRSQQEALQALLQQLEGVLKPKLPPDVGSTRTHHQAKVLTMQIDELDRGAEELAKETKKVQASLYEEPLTTVVQVLDAHASALDAIQAQANTVVQRLRVVESTL